MKLKIVVGNGNYEDVELVGGTLRQGGEIIVDRSGVRTRLLINSLVTDDQPDLAICTLLSVMPAETPA